MTDSIIQEGAEKVTVGAGRSGSRVPLAGRVSVVGLIGAPTTDPHVVSEALGCLARIHGRHLVGVGLQAALVFELDLGLLHGERLKPNADEVGAGHGRRAYSRALIALNRSPNQSPVKP